MKWLREHALGLTMFILFLLFLAGQSVAGYANYNEEQQQHNQSGITYSEYIKSGDFIEGVFENWESEFLQMGSFVILTVFLRHKGSSESKKLIGKESVDQEPKQTTDKNAPWPVRKGGWILSIYKNSLSLALIMLFIFSIFLHAYGGSRATCEENLIHGQQECYSTIGYMGTSKFWYESFQNWQSEYLALAAMIVFSVYLRQQGSPESKPVSAPYAKTGSG
ncbi:MAG: rane protein [Candidatus Saccharibacteria bacterium]|nr:rane protein [Candidatus Saccharibacteria bacterium]